MLMRAMRAAVQLAAHGPVRVGARSPSASTSARPRSRPAPAVANHALGGVSTVDITTAFASMPLFGPEGWDDAVCREAGASADALPEVANMGVPIGRVTGVARAAGVAGAAGADAVLAGG